MSDLWGELSVPVTLPGQLPELPRPYDEGERIRQLIAEAQAAEVPERNYLLEFVDHPGVMRNRYKSEAEGEGDYRRDYLLQRLQEAHENWKARGPASRAENPWPLQGAAAEALSRYESDPAFRESLQSPFTETGWFGSGSGLDNFANFFTAPVQGALQGGHVAANAADRAFSAPGMESKAMPKSDQQAYEDWERALGTAIPPLEHPAYPSVWTEKQRAYNNAELAFPWYRTLDPSQGRQAGQELGSQVQGMEGSEDYLNSYGVDKMIGKWPTRVWGTVMDSAIIPGGTMAKGGAFLGASKLSRAGKHLKALKGLGIEYAPDAGFMGLQAYGEGYEPQR